MCVESAVKPQTIQLTVVVASCGDVVVAVVVCVAVDVLR